MRKEDRLMIKIFPIVEKKSEKRDRILKIQTKRDKWQKKETNSEKSEPLQGLHKPHRFF